MRFFLHGWFHLCITLQSYAPGLFADLTGVAETSLALGLLLGIARRAGYTVGIIYALLFGALLALAPPARDERLSLDRKLIRRLTWRKLAAEPHAEDRR